jgi:hypothetical protein
MYYTDITKLTKVKGGLKRMDFMSRGSRSGQPSSQINDNASSNSSSTSAIGGTDRTKTANVNRNQSNSSKGARIGGVIMLFSITVLLVALIASLIFGNPAKSGNSEFRNVDASKLQAVFLNGGQVYFGKINSLNPQFMRMSDIYYLRVNQQVQPGQTQPADDGISLVKLGCELHGPTDSMVINREQVIFWENLKEDGQVAKAVKEFKDKNPEGQKCEQPQQGSNATEPAANDAPATPPATPPADAGNATP